MPKVTVSVDPETCISAANCVGIAPQFYTIDSNSYAEVLDRHGKPQGTTYALEVTAEELALLEETVESCPTRAIVLSHDAA